MRSLDMNLLRNLRLPACAIAVISVAAAMGVWQRDAAKPITPSVPASVQEDRPLVPEEVQSELAFMASIHSSVERDCRMRERDWHAQLDRPLPAAISKVRSELESLRQATATLEQLPPIDVSIFASRPPSRIWGNEQRLSPNKRPVPLPPSFGVEVGVGPDGAVLAHSGELRIPENDLTLPSRGGIGFAFHRTYRSFSNYDGPMGLGWDHNHNIRLTADGSSLGEALTLQLRGGDFHVTFSKKGNGWEVARGAFLHLQVQPDGCLHVTDGHRSRWIFEPAVSPPRNNACWRLQQRQTRHAASTGNRLVYRYIRGTDVLTSVEDPFGQVVRFYYNGQGRLVLLMAPSRRIGFTYGRDGSLLSATEPQIAISFSETSDRGVAYAYQRAGDRIWCTSRLPPAARSGLIAEYDLEEGSESYGRVVRAGYRVVGSPEMGICWELAAIRNGECLDVTVRPPAPAPKVLHAYLTTNPYPWLPSLMTIPSRKATWSYEYNGDGLCTRETDPDGFAVVRRYDDSSSDARSRQNCLEEQTVGLIHSPDEILRAKGRSTEYATGTAFPTRISHYQVDGNGSRDVLVEERHRYRDDTMDLLESIHGDEPSWFFWNRHGQLLSEVQGDGAITMYAYSPGLPEQDMSAVAEGSPEGAGVTVRVTKDVAIDQLQKVVALEDRARVTLLPRRVSPAPLASESTYFLYDRLGRKIGQTGPGHLVFTVLNRLGDVLASWDSSSDLTVSQYDQLFRRVDVLHRLDASFQRTLGGYQGSSCEPLGGRFFRESFDYDAWGRIVAFSPTDEPVSAALGQPTYRYTRYPSGALREVTDASGTTRVHDVDTETGLVAKVRLQGSDGLSITLREFLEYSPAGKVVSYKDEHGDTWATQLDSLGRPSVAMQPSGVVIQTHLDGLDRPTKTISKHEGRIIDEQRWSYTASGRPATVRRKHIQERGDQAVVSLGDIVVLDRRYDPVGRVVEERGPRADSWRRIVYDGVGNVIAEKSPEGDWLLSLYRDGHRVVTSGMPQTQGSDALAAYREVTVLDERFRPFVVVPVDSEGIAQWPRGSIRMWSPGGRLSEVLEPEGLHLTYAYETRGNRVQETVRPSRSADSDEHQLQAWRFDAWGRCVFHSTEVSPLAVFKQGLAGDTALMPIRLPLPQEASWEYDSLGRLTRHVQPDGLVVSRAYRDGGSMVTRMTWRHLTEPDTVLRDLDFRYGPQQRLEAVSLHGVEVPLQQFKYDPWGQCNVAADLAGHETVTVRREWTNFGLKCGEQISYGPTILQDLRIESSPESGLRRFQWRQPTTLPAVFWSEASYGSDRAGRVSSLSLDGDVFCQWDYHGQMPVTRDIPSSRTRRKLALSPMAEIVGMRFESRDDTEWAVLSEMRYVMDSRGSVTASTIKLRNLGGDRDSVLSQFTQIDDYRQIIACAQEPVAWNDLEARRRDLLLGGDPAAAVRTSRMHRDQAGNIYASYQGRWSDTPLTTAKEKGRVCSPCEVIAFQEESETQGDPEALIRVLTEDGRLDLASNRLAVTASQGREQQTFRYDKLGQLSEYPGAYWNGEKSQPVFWALTFDPLGRLKQMKAFERAPGAVVRAATAKVLAELGFAYDTDNRRIVKRITDHASHEVRREATLYCESQPTIAMKQSDDGNWIPFQQYVWGAAPAEVLQVITAPSTAGLGSSPLMERYSLHQDRELNVVFATSLERGRVHATSLASYLDTGENSSIARVAGVRSSMPAQSLDSSHDQRVDNGQATTFAPKGKWNWVEIELSTARRVSELTIWTDEFPNDFDIYATDGDGVLPAGDHEIERWTERARSDGRLLGFVAAGVFQGSAGTRRKLSVMDCPYEIRLNGVKTKCLVLVFRGDPQRDIGVSVAEFEVNALPETAASLGQNGAWIDQETGLYFQHHRYRLPAMNGKFISPDPLGFLGGPDLYAYANNNPLEWHDPDGRFAHVLWGAGIGAAFGGFSYLIDCWWSGEEFSWYTMGIRTGAGALSGAAATATFGFAIGPMGLTLASSASGATAGFVNNFSVRTAEGVLLEGQSLGDAATGGLYEGAKGAATGFAAGGAGAAVGGWLANLPRASSVWRGLGTAVAAGAAGGTGGGAVNGSWTGVERYGLSQEAAVHAAQSTLWGAGYGAVIGGGMFGVGYGMDRMSGRTWGQSRQDYWKREAEVNPEAYSPDNLARMRSGRAPQRINPETGATESLELHHKYLPQRSGLPRTLTDRPENLQKVWPDEHRAVDPYRH